MQHSIYIVSAKTNNNGRIIDRDKYYVTYNGQQIGKFKYPLLDSARYLLNAGLAFPEDELIMLRGDLKCMFGNILKLSQMSIDDNSKTGPRFRKFVPYPTHL